MTMTQGELDESLRQMHRENRNKAIEEALRAGVDFDTVVKVLRTTHAAQYHFPAGITNDEVRAEFLADLDEDAERADRYMARAKQIADEVADLRALINR